MKTAKTTQLSNEAIRTITDALTCQLNICKSQMIEIEATGKNFHEVADKLRSTIITQLRVNRALEEIKGL